MGKKRQEEMERSGYNTTPINLEPILEAVKKTPEGERFLRELEEGIGEIQTRVEKLNKVSGTMVDFFAHTDQFQGHASFKNFTVSNGGDGTKRFVESVNNEAFSIDQALRNMRNGYPWDTQW
jgi:hypothetical protein